MLAKAKEFIVAFRMAPPYMSAYGLTSVPPPARPILRGARLLIIIFKIYANIKELLQFFIKKYGIYFLPSPKIYVDEKIFVVP
jgi:hypothetical protein